MAEYYLHYQVMRYIHVVKSISFSIALPDDFLTFPLQILTFHFASSFWMIQSLFLLTYPFWFSSLCWSWSRWLYFSSLSSIFCCNLSRLTIINICQLFLPSLRVWDWNIFFKSGLICKKTCFFFRPLFIEDLEKDCFLITVYVL